MLLEFYTTIPGITPEEVHQIGLDEVKQLREKLTGLAVKLGLPGLTFKEFTQKMKANETHFFKR